MSNTKSMVVDKTVITKALLKIINAEGLISNQTYLATQKELNKEEVVCYESNKEE